MVKCEYCKQLFEAKRADARFCSDKCRVTANRARVTANCRTCGGPVQHPKIRKCLKCCTGTPAPARAEPVEPEESGPLSVYSPSRWAYLESRGHIWDEQLGRSYRQAEYGTMTIGVAVPGDPAY